MKYYIFRFISVVIYLTVVLAAPPEDVSCDKCARRGHCELFRHMDPKQQYRWTNKYPCTKVLNNGSYISIVNGIYVCCSIKLWIDGSEYSSNDDKHRDIYGLINELNMNNKTLPSPVAPKSEQCVVSSFPLAPETQCCGFEASESERMNAATSTTSPVDPTAYSGSRFERSPGTAGTAGSSASGNNTTDANITENNSIGARITDGHETSLYQFPWTVHLKVIFDHDEQQKKLCGGSLISSRYVLTAAHCVYNSSRTLTRVEVYLAEYDTSTFPIDCKDEINYGKQCVNNIFTYAEGVVRHPLFNNRSIYYDIALIRLKESVPHSVFIKPICLPPFDIDDVEDLANMPLVVTGWGLKNNKSNTKQSAVLNLVPHEQCKKDYPDLFIRQMCAVGNSGGDTCRGDSGGPLMMVYKGQYYLVGIVSGKWGDASCGTIVPTVFTNVYKYLDWIFRYLRK